MSYRLVRVNTRGDHTTRELAFDDMVSIIERGFYWKQSQLPAIPWGTQMIGMGSYGGQVGPVLDNAYVILAGETTSFAVSIGPPPPAAATRPQDGVARTRA